MRLGAVFSAVVYKNFRIQYSRSERGRFVALFVTGAELHCTGRVRPAVALCSLYIYYSLGTFVRMGGGPRSARTEPADTRCCCTHANVRARRRVAAAHHVCACSASDAGFESARVARPGTRPENEGARRRLETRRRLLRSTACALSLPVCSLARTVRSETCVTGASAWRLGRSARLASLDDEPHLLI